MKKLVTLAIAVSIVASTATAGSERFLKKGYIQNDSGNKCWYTQSTNPDSTYFFGSGVKSTVGVITFDDPRCMSDRGLGLDINKRTINIVISRWYSFSDAKFKTGVSELYKGSRFGSQKKGKCIQSKKYPAQGITIDYFVENNSITGAIHGPSVHGCKRWSN